MTENKRKNEPTHLDPREFDLPETTYSRDIENRVFQGIVLKTLSNIDGIGLVEGTFLDSLIGRLDKIKGIIAEQDPKTHSVRIKIEVRVAYGVSIPQIADEIQTLVSQEITKMTGVRVSEVHVIFRELMSQEPIESLSALNAPERLGSAENVPIEDEF